MRVQVKTSGVEEAQRALESVYKTVEKSGSGEVVTSTLHSDEVVSFLQSEGVDPFDYSAAPEVEAMLADAIEDVMERVARTGRPETDYIRRVMIGASMDVAEWTRERIEKGGLGKRNTRRTAEYKSRLVADGRATREYGDPPPYGIRSGDFIRDISGSWSSRKAAR